MTSKAAQIVGKVLYTAGDGVAQKIPHGAVEIESTSTDVTISWRSVATSGGETSSVASMPLDNYTTYLTNGCIKLDE